MNTIKKKYSLTDIVGTEYNFFSDGKSQLSITSEYITKSTLMTYLRRNNHNEGRIFQCFVFPQGEYNCMVYSPFSFDKSVMVTFCRSMSYREDDKYKQYKEYKDTLY